MDELTFDSLCLNIASTQQLGDTAMALIASLSDNLVRNFANPNLAASINDAIAQISAYSNPDASNVVVISRKTGSSTNNVTVSTVAGGPSGERSTVTTQQSDGGSDAAQTENATAIIVAKNNNAKIIITDNADDGGSTILIQTTDDTQLGGLSTIVINTQDIAPDSRIVYGNISKDVETNQYYSLFLVIPKESSGSDEDEFLFSSVSAADTIDPDTAFSNSGFTTFSGRDSYQTYGGAVAIEVSGQKTIFWLDTDQFVSSDFNGEIQARAGFLDGNGEASFSTTAGYYNDLSMIFENGSLNKIWQGTESFDSFNDYFAYMTGQNLAPVEVDQNQVDNQNSFIVNNSQSYAIGAYDRTYALTSALNQSGYDDITNRADLTRKYNVEYQTSRV